MGEVILNPGSEGARIEAALRDARISYSKTCTLVLAATGQFDRMVCV